MFEVHIGSSLLGRISQGLCSLWVISNTNLSLYQITAHHNYHVIVVRNALMKVYKQTGFNRKNQSPNERGIVNKSLAILPFRNYKPQRTIQGDHIQAIGQTGCVQTDMFSFSDSELIRAKYTTLLITLTVSYSIKKGLFLNREQTWVVRVNIFRGNPLGTTFRAP